MNNGIQFLQMNQPIEINHKLASRKRRILAFLIDHFTMTFLIVAIMFLSLGTDFLDGDNVQGQMSRMLPALAVGMFIYFTKDGIKGISFGKWVMGIMVRDEYNRNKVPSLPRLILRNLFIIIYPIEFIVMATSSRKQRLGDSTAKTVVVKNPNKQKQFPRIVAVILVGFGLMASMIIFVGATMKSSDAYKVAIEHIENNEKIIKETGGITGYGIMPTGNINISNGTGEANLRIKVIGEENDISVGAELTKSPNGEWQLRKLHK